MFDVNKIQTGFTGLVGIRQPLDPEYAFLDADNQASASGLFLDDISNFKVRLYVDTQDYKDATDAQLNDDLRNIQKAATVSICQNVFGNESYVDRNFIYSNATNRQDVETTLKNGFVGFKIVPSHTKNIAFKISRLRLEFEGAGDVKIVLFNSALNTPLFEKVVTISSNSQIEDLDWTVNNTADDYKGEYYLGYIYDGTLTPYKRNYEFSNSRNYIAELSIEPSFCSGANDTQMFDIDEVDFLSENTGLNPDITVYFDYTDMILQNKNLFAKALQLQWGIMVMQRYISTTRSNGNERLSKEIILRTIETIEGTASSAPIKVTGVKQYLGDELDQLRKAIEDLKRGYFIDGIQVITVS